MNPPYLHRHNQGILLAVRVVPKSSHSKITGVLGSELKVALQSPPAEGKANKELIHLFSKLFSIPKSHIEIRSGKTSRSKTLFFHTTDEEWIQSQLNKILP